MQASNAVLSEGGGERERERDLEKERERRERERREELGNGTVVPFGRN